MIPLNLKEIIDIVTKYYGIEIISMGTTTIDSPDSAVYLLKDEHGRLYALRESDHLSGLEYEKNTVEKVLGRKVNEWLPLLVSNLDIAYDGKYVASPDLYYALASVNKDLSN
jgi:hypothetical protein